MRAGEMGLTVESAELPNDICGLYDDRHGLILLADWLNQRQRRCTLCHELIHAKHHDPGCGTRYGAKCERRCRRETALTLISPVDYGMVEPVVAGTAADLDCCWSLDSLFFSGDHAGHSIVPP